MKIACDTCEVVTDLEGVIGWVSTETIGCDISTFSDVSASRRFCSVSCLVDFFMSNKTGINLRRVTKEIPR